MVWAYPSVHPTGTTIYEWQKTWNGYTIFGIPARPGEPVVARLIDMNGKIVHTWEGVHGMPYKILPGGFLMGPETFFTPTNNVVQVDWNGNVVRRFPNVDEHHDFQREPNPVGYYVPGMDPMVDGGETLILGNDEDKKDNIVIMDWDGNVIWRWDGVDHIDEIKPGQPLDINTASWLGPNKWYDAGDERFHPDNIICDNLVGDVIFIISRATGAVVWKLGPDYTDAPELVRFGLGEQSGDPQRGNFVGGMLHHAHMIPKGLPGQGNILVFNNGSPFSIVTEFDPTTLEVVWEYSGEALGYGQSHSLAHSFCSPTAGSAQRLPNGNTMITESDTGRIFEVTPALETVWEYINPFPEFFTLPGQKKSPFIYRAYRVPYDWIPQLVPPSELPVTPPAYGTYQIPPSPMPSNTRSTPVRPPDRSPGAERVSFSMS